MPWLDNRLNILGISFRTCFPGNKNNGISKIEEELEALGFSWVRTSKSTWVPLRFWTFRTKYLNKWWTSPPAEPCITNLRSLDGFECLTFGITRDRSSPEKNVEVGLISTKGFKRWGEQAVEISDIRWLAGGKMWECLNNSRVCSIETCLPWIKFGQCWNKELLELWEK